jgi:WD40 repeat protein
LALAKRQSELELLLSNYEWVQLKTNTHELVGLIHDYNWSSSKSASALQNALWQCAQILKEDPTQLSGQLIGRLSPDLFPALRHFVDQASQAPTGPWLRPQTTSLDPSGGQRFQLIIAAHEKRINGVAVTPDGKQAISASSDHTLKVWDLQSGEMLHTLTGHESDVLDVTVAPDGRRAVSVSGDKTLIVWDFCTGKQSRRIKSPAAEWAVIVSADGARAVSGAQDGRLRFWDLDQGRLVRTLRRVHKDAVWQVAVSTDERLAVSASQDGTLRSWDIASGKLLAKLVAQDWSDLFRCVKLTSDDRYAVVGMGSGVVVIWDPWHGEIDLVIHPHQQVVRGLALTTDNENIVSISADGRIVATSMATGKRQVGVRRFAQFNGVDLAANGMLVAGTVDGKIHVWDLAGLLVRSPLEHRDFVVGVCTGGEAHVVSGGMDGTIKVWSAESEPPLKDKFEVSGRELLQMAVTPDARHIVFSSRRLAEERDDWFIDIDVKLHFWDLHMNSRWERQTETEIVANCFALSPDGRFVVAVTNDKDVTVWHATDGTELRKIRSFGYWVGPMLITPDSSRILAVRGSSDAPRRRTLAVWNMETGRKERTLKGYGGEVRALACQDSRHTIAGCSDNTIRIWDLSNGKLLRTLKGHEDSVLSVAVTPDGSQAVSASNDHTLKIWDLLHGREIQTLSGHTSGVKAAALSPSASNMASVDDRSLRVWDLHHRTCLASFTGNNVLGPGPVFVDEHTVAVGESTGAVHILRLKYSGK